jgi:hypothetical protein
MNEGLRLNDAQARALLELLVLGMYADGHLAGSEELRLHAFLLRQGLTEEDDRRTRIGDAIGRVSRHTGSAGEREKFLTALTAAFPDELSRGLALSLVEDLFVADNALGEREEQLLVRMRQAFNG